MNTSRLVVFCLSVFISSAMIAEESDQSLPSELDITAALKLAGARSTEIQIAEAHRAEALAMKDQVVQKFWPSFTTGVTYRTHGGRTQNIDGDIQDASKQAYTAGAGVWLDWAPAQIYYESLAAKQRALAATELTGKSRADTLLKAASFYYDLLNAEASLAVSQDDLKLNTDYAKQLEGAVNAGTVFRGDLLKVKTQINRNELAIRQAIEKREAVSAKLAEVLRLDATVRLRPTKADLVPMRLQDAGDTKKLVQNAILSRPEIHVQMAMSEAAEMDKKQATVAPWYPSFTANYAFGGLGGGQSGGTGSFGGSEDSFVGLGWKIGPDGLFDGAKKRAAEARVNASHLQVSKSKDNVALQVTESSARVRSLSDQIKISAAAVANSEELVKLARARQASQIGVVLEYLLASEDLSKSRLDQASSITEHNKAQYALRYAIGQLGGTTEASEK